MEIGSTRTAPRRHAGAPWLLGALVVQGAVMGVGAAATASLHAQLERLSVQVSEHAAATDRSALGLARLRASSERLGAQLDDVRRTMAAPTRQASLFLKVLLLKPGIDPALARRIARAVEAECARAGQDPNLVLSVMAVESNFNPDAVSAAGAEGLMQVMPLWKQPLGLEQLHEPEVSIRAGVHILTAYQQRFGDLDLTVTAYHRGPTAVSEALAAGQAPQTGYSDRVLAVWRRLRALDLAAPPG
jgi:soluble lytic murein transglycosylase-like protein